VREVGAERIGDRDDALGRSHADVEVHAVGHEATGRPLDAVDELGVTLARGLHQVEPPSEGVQTARDERLAAGFHDGAQFAQRRGQIAAGVVDRFADAGDDLDRGQVQLVLGLGVLAVGVPGPDERQDLGGVAGQRPGPAIDDPELDLDAQGGALRGVEGDVHGPSGGASGGSATSARTGRTRWAPP
jgi:hypothetical protein